MACRLCSLMWIHSESENLTPLRYCDNHHYKLTIDYFNDISYNTSKYPNSNTPLKFIIDDDSRYDISDISMSLSNNKSITFAIQPETYKILTEREKNIKLTYNVSFNDNTFFIKNDNYEVKIDGQKIIDISYNLKLSKGKPGNI